MKFISMHHHKNYKGFIIICFQYNFIIQNLCFIINTKVFNLLCILLKSEAYVHMLSDE